MISITVWTGHTTTTDKINSWENCEQNATAFARSTFWYNVAIANCRWNWSHEQKRIIKWPIIYITVFIELWIISISKKVFELKLSVTLVCFNAKLRSLIDHIIYKSATYFMINSTESFQHYFTVDLEDDTFIIPQILSKVTIGHYKSKRHFENEVQMRGNSLLRIASVYSSITVGCLWRI